MYHPTTRLLAVLELLQSHQSLSGATLSQRLEIDRRSVRRYIAMLQDMGIPIETRRGPHGGYRLRPGYRLPPLMFTEDEALAITLGLLAARRFGLTTDALGIESALAKVDRALPVASRVRMQGVQETLAFLPERSPRPPDSGIVLELSAAIRQNRQVRMRYRAWSGEESERTCDPYGLVYHGGRCYLVGWCHLREGVRVFRADRVLHAALRVETFIRPTDIDCTRHVVQSLASVPYDWSVEVLLDTTPAEVRRRIPPTLATMEETGDGVVLRVQAESLRWVAGLLISLECPFTIRRPAALRDALRKVAQDIACLAEYAADTPVS
jgi:predicted DNA-binding transcriptional regulator YafY